MPYPVPIPGARPTRRRDGRARAGTGRCRRLDSHRKCSVAPSIAIVEHRCDDGLDLGARERSAVRRAAPEPSFHNDAIESGTRLPAPYGHDRRRGPAGDEELHERGRRVVEQMGVVDGEEQAARSSSRRRAATMPRNVASRPRPIAASGTRCATAPSGTVAADCVAATHSVRSAFRRDTSEHLACQSRLADARGAGEHDAVARLQRGGRQLQLVVVARRAASDSDRRVLHCPVRPRAGPRHASIAPSPARPA